MVNLLLNGSSCQQPVNRHLLFLPNPPGTLTSLQEEVNSSDHYCMLQAENFASGTERTCILDVRYKPLADLSVCAGVPVWVVDYNPICSSQIDSQTANSCCQEEDEDVLVL